MSGRTRIGGMAEAGSRRRPAAAFTLIEMLLVIVIIGFAMVIAFPMLGSAMTGGRLRAATRSIVMAGRHARCMAVLQQKPMTLEFDLGGGRITVRAEDGGTEFSRELEKIRIQELRVGDELQQSEGKWGVVYQNNGTCTPYVLTLADSKNRLVTVTVDSLGSPRTEEGNP